jgi:membrane protein implicated in regulation of membrane protease activity
MGIGGGVFLLAIGAILAYAVHANISFIDLRVAGWVLMFAGALVLGLTLWYLTRRRKPRPLVEEAQTAHGPNAGGVNRQQT